MDGVPQEPETSGLLGTALPLMAPESLETVPAVMGVKNHSSLFARSGSAI